MKKFPPLLIFTSLLMVFLLGSCKKDQQIVSPPTPAPSNDIKPDTADIKLDTAFQFTATYQGSSYPVFEVTRTFYIPVLDSIINPDLKVYRAWLAPSHPSQEVYPYAGPTLGAFYTRDKGLITYSEGVIGYSSVKILVKIVGRW